MTGAEIKNKLGNIEAATMTALAYTVLVTFYGRTIEVHYYNDRDEYNFTSEGCVAGYFHYNPNNIKAAIERRIASLESRAKSLSEKECISFNEAMEYTAF